MISPIATPAPSIFDGNAAYQHVIAQVGLGARPTGSAALQKTGDYIIEQLRSIGWQVETQEFDYKNTHTRNIIAKRGSGPIIIIGAHYDTRMTADQDPDPGKRNQPVMGANDRASGVAVLLELARTLNIENINREVWLTFFDAEDNGEIDGWDWGVGSTYMADHLTISPTAMILLDMIGDANLNISWEQNSNPALNQSIWDIAATLGYSQSFLARPGWTMIDDHLAFIRHGIPSVDLIDFDYPYWHTTQDTADKVSPVSLERVGRTLQTWLEQSKP
ncbi:MAG TPA: M28 family peptidase [Anaerolineae bacterium]|nr:M28 family peptidase [Anaerolineae bacterium]